jgi:hypothetical protein
MSSIVYVHPNDVLIPAIVSPTDEKLYMASMRKNGQTQPIKCFVTHEGRYAVEDSIDAPKVIAARRLNWVQIGIEVVQ